jgi:hypothetical protein
MATLTLLAGVRSFTPYANVIPILYVEGGQLPAELKNVDSAKWNAWNIREDSAIRARLRQGDLDSTVNFLLFGTSFTKQPRISVEAIGEA